LDSADSSKPDDSRVSPELAEEDEARQDSVLRKNAAKERLDALNLVDERAGDGRKNKRPRVLEDVDEPAIEQMMIPSKVGQSSSGRGSTLQAPLEGHLPKRRSNAAKPGRKERKEKRAKKKQDQQG